MFSRFFIERPVFSWVLAIVIMVVGALSILKLPVSQFPHIAPPQVAITAMYPGASAQTISNTVTQVIEQNLTGLDGFVYMSSTSDSAGRLAITLTFEPGTDADMASVQVQNKVQAALSQLPDVVQRLGVTVEKTADSFLMVVGFVSTDSSVSSADIGDFVSTNIVDTLSRVPGVGGTQVFGTKYAMRIWLDPDSMSRFALNTDEVLAAIKAQNMQLAVGGIAQQPTNGKQEYTASITGESLLQTPEEFRNIFLKVTRDGAQVRLGDVARIEVGQQSYAMKSTFNGFASAGVGLKLSPGANALDTADRIMKKVDQLRPSFPKGVQTIIPYDTTPFVRAAMHEVVKALFEAIILVILVMYLFLQNLRATLIPSIAVPVVLLGTFGILGAVGFSINMLTMFAMVLAIGLLVDDAIVVVENVERVMREDGTDPKTATIKSMREIQGALVGIALVLSAVFVPMAFFGGSTGVIYRQFSVTIVSAMALSVLVALTLTPSLCAQILKPIDKEHHEAKTGFFGMFNRGFDAVTHKVKNFVGWMIRSWGLMLLVYGVIVGFVAVGFVKMPTGFMPAEDQGLLLTMTQLPEGSTMERTDIELEKMRLFLQKTEGKNIDAIFTVRGFSFAGMGQNMAVGFMKLKDWSERPSPTQSDKAIQRRAMGALMFAPSFNGAQTYVFPLPAVPELGLADGFDFYIQDIAGGSHERLMALMGEMLKKASANPKLKMVRYNGMPDAPELKLVIDHKKLSAMGLDIATVNRSIATIMSGSYINDYADRGRIKQVWVQGTPEARYLPEDVLRWEVRNQSGQMVPLKSFAELKWSYGSPRLERFNGLDAVNIQGTPAPGVSSGEAMDTIEAIAKEILPPGYRIAWHGISYQEKEAGQQGGALYALSLLVVFLSLAALYESWTIPFSVLLVVPCGVIGAQALTWVMGMKNDVYFQVALLTTIGLVSKNAILIVEFAREYMQAGQDAVHAVQEAVRVRLRPIMMTSLAFGFGVLPMALATGPGAGAQNAIGIGVFGGMVAGTLLCVIFVPVFYVLVTRLFSKKTSQEA